MHRELPQGVEKSVIATKITPSKAVSRGNLTVNGAVMSMMFGVPAFAFAVPLLLGLDVQTAGAAAGLAFIASWPLAWLTWSVLVVRWRVWAYERVDDLDELKMHAVAAGLIWRDGHFFERTEIRSQLQRKRIRELEQAWVAKRGDRG